METKCCKEELAGKLYTVYCESVGGVAFNGEPLPTWEVFSADPEKTMQADGWRAVAETSMVKCESEVSCDEPEAA